MITGIGVDLIEIERLRRAVERHGKRFEQRVFTAAEQADCEHRADRLQALAARFAAKEAAMKALGTGWAKGVGFLQIEVVRGAGGEPGLRLHGAAAERFRRIGARQARISLSHQPSMAVAVVVFEA